MILPFSNFIGLWTVRSNHLCNGAIFLEICFSFLRPVLVTSITSKLFTGRPSCFSSWLRNSMNLLKVSSFDFNKYTWQKRELSLMKVMKYFMPPPVMKLLKSQVSEWIRSSRVVLLVTVGKGLLMILTCTQISQFSGLLPPRFWSKPNIASRLFEQNEKYKQEKSGLFFKLYKLEHEIGVFRISKWLQEGDSEVGVFPSSRAIVRPWTLCLKQCLVYSGATIPKPNCPQE